MKRGHLKILVRTDPEFLEWRIAGVPIKDRILTSLAGLSETPIEFLPSADTPLNCDERVDYLIVNGAFPFITADLVQCLRQGGDFGEPRVAFPPDSQESGVVFLPANHAAVEADTFGAFLDRLFDLTDEESGEDLLELRDAASYAKLNQYAFDRKVTQVIAKGALVIAPHMVWIEESVSVEAGAKIGPNVYLGGDTYLGSGAEVMAGAQLRDATVAYGAVIRPYSVLESCRVGAGATVGPFAHLRAGTDLGEDVRIGNFVETKKVTMGANSKASHLAYLGDAQIGKDCNIGAGTITCNYDGVNKHQTVLGDQVFIGSDSQLVAPVTIGDKGFVAAGSTITRDVPADGLAIARARQDVKEGRASRMRERARKKKAKAST
ncbi:hypothetical protein SCOR_18195 [Sulfidibacter corallicola]|uniref:Mannose-1-phosphate guanyltransferase C-terminal domain-containing protein n=1 Tax=Sulfidibacter corallicola TaxID=2818388 RepID=A0A8A4U4E0_SULCO|nr:DapH/DapD/GlmU-related protein [Sulfidibacter corallicola]QTD53615.1 hypothetical protein J3U87_14265 [Sulfidibacter corallicola]